MPPGGGILTRFAILFLPGFVGNGQLFTALPAARRKYAAAIGRRHPLTETMFILSFSLRRLIRTLHASKIEAQR